MDVFPQAEGGAEAMAAEFGVPFLGRVPLDRGITQASQQGTAAHTQGIEALVEQLLHVT